MSLTGSMRLMTVRVCVAAVCVRHGPRYTVSSWSECSKACGYGLQYRAVGCATVRALVVTAVIVAVVAGSRTAPPFAHPPLLPLPSSSPAGWRQSAAVQVHRRPDGSSPCLHPVLPWNLLQRVRVHSVLRVPHDRLVSMAPRVLSNTRFPEWCSSSHCDLQPTPWKWWCCCFVLRFVSHYYLPYPYHQAWVIRFPGIAGNRPVPGETVNHLVTTRRPLATPSLSLPRTSSACKRRRAFALLDQSSHASLPFVFGLVKRREPCDSCLPPPLSLCAIARTQPLFLRAQGTRSVLCQWVLLQLEQSLWCRLCLTCVVLCAVACVRAQIQRPRGPELQLHRQPRPAP